LQRIALGKQSILEKAKISRQNVGFASFLYHAISPCERLGGIFFGMLKFMMATTMNSTVSRVLYAARHARYYATGKIERLLRQVKRLGMDPSEARQDIFSEIYSQKLWGREKNASFFSGGGSRGEAATTYADRMAELLREYIIEVGRPVTIIDLGCGDFQVGRALLDRLPDSSYIGCDIVPELVVFNNKKFAGQGVRFQTVDIVSGELPSGDVCLVRQVLQHLSNADISTFMNRQNYPLLYVTEGQPSEIIGRPNPDKVVSAHVRFNTATGRGRGVELDKSPFNYRTSEVFRAPSPPHEIIITHRVSRQDGPVV
jgi:hypothetical protein